MMDAGLMLLITILLPLGGALLLGLLPRQWASRNLVRYGALAITIVTLVMALGLVARFPTGDTARAGFAVTSVPWLGDGVSGGLAGGPGRGGCRPRGALV